MINPVKTAIDLVYGHKPLLAAVIIINIAGSLFGLYYYWGQLMMTPYYYWLFVPDCPLYTFFMIFALVFIAAGRRFDTFNAVTAIGLSMYGTWTMFVLLFFREVYFAPGNALMSTALWVSHGGMALESVLLLPYIRKAGPASWLAAGAWFLVQTFFDYFVTFSFAGLPMRLHPLALLEYYAIGTQGLVALEPKLGAMMYITFAMVLIFTALMLVLSRAWGFIAPETESPEMEPTLTTRSS